MAIVCGTDFSEDSARAELAAAHLARRLGQVLHLVHAVDVGAGEQFDEPRGALADWARRHLVNAGQRLGQLGCRVETHVEPGAPDDVLLAVAREVSARMLVIAALSRRRARGDELGSHSERIARRGDLPVVVVRDPRPFEAWGDARPLRVLLAADLTSSSEGAIAWVAELAGAGPCEVIAAHIYWPPGEYRRLGLRGARSLVEPDAEVTRALERDLRAQLEPHLAAGGASLSLRIEPNLGRIPDRLIGLAIEERADVVALGAHRRGPLARLWEGSVSRAVMRDERLTVACAPAARDALGRAAPQMRVVLAATDLSPLGEAAVALAYAVVRHGGAVHLVHVDAELGRGRGGPDALAEVHRRLAEQVPADAASRGVTTEIHILDDKDAAEAICQAAERVGADAVCLGTQGRAGLARALLGSVAGQVIASTHRAVMLARPPRE